MQDQFFQGLKVVELASVLAGPAVGLFFAELGARVTKIENAATSGDVTRRWKAPTEAANKSDSAYYQSVNFGKTTLLVNLKSTAGREQVEALIREADIVIVNYRPGAATKLGMDYDRLKGINPKIIYAELTGFGANDPRLAFDVVLQAESGFLYLTGEPGRSPVKMPVALIDILAAHQLKEGILVALLKRAQTGRGSKVSTSLYAAALASLANQATNWLIAGFAPQRLGSQHPNIAPYGDLFRTADGQELVLAVGVEAHWKKLGEVLNVPELINDDRFATNAQRVKHRLELIPLLQEQIGAFAKREELLALFQKNNIPAGAVRDLPDVFAQPLAQTLLVNTFDESGQAIQCVKSVVFELSE
ncbi:CaiB/BaiF CoA transferase family protein [Lewinella cohaerens]|uniref:CaiB/BaiF CoA transferase family protein n=1 Tax=Lewinella cohaerens TaxID=70995 RepID=UPI00037BF78C|nr:CoA transferase [Lewinella cohaerens]